MRLDSETFKVLVSRRNLPISTNLVVLFFVVSSVYQLKLLTTSIRPAIRITKTETRVSV